MATFWLALLWLGAPLLGTLERDASTLAERAADRARNAIVLGVAIPFALGYVHALYGEMCLVLAMLCVAVAWRPVALRAAAVASAGYPPISRAWPWLTVVTASLVLLLWPQLVRPPLDGDTLAYHLPNAFSWVQTHTVWITGTRYWWYPGGSELFASGLIAVGARWSLPLAGACAALLVAFRLTAFAARRCSSSRAAIMGGALCAVALLSVPAAAAQVGTLQNDLWLAAAVLEVLWSLLYTRSSRALIASVALCSLVKPLGPVVALVAAFAYFVARVVIQRGEPPFSARAIDVTGGFIPLALWIVRDVLLAPAALIPIASTMVADPWRTTIAGQGLAGIATLARALVAAGVATLALALVPLAAFIEFLVRAARRTLGDDGVAFGALGLTGVLVSVLYLVAPFGFTGSVPQLLNGASLRFDLPAIACGAAIASLVAARLPLVVGAAALASSLYGIVRFEAIFWNDAVTRSTVFVAALCALLVMVMAAVITWRPWWRRWVAGAGTACAAALLCVGVALAAPRAVSFYDAGLSAAAAAAAATPPVDSTPRSLFARLARLRPRAVVALDVRGGAIAMVSPGTRVYDALDVAPCTQARRLGALLVVGTDRDTPASLRLARRAMALHGCGRVLYSDSASVIAAPSAAAAAGPGAADAP